MFRPRLVAASLVIVASCPWFVREARAQQTPANDLRLPTSLLQPLQAAEEGQSMSSLQLTAPAPAKSESVVFRSPAGSQTLMTSLYASTAAMQVLDVHSTLKALDRGAIETNPLMSGLAGNHAAF